MGAVLSQVEEGKERGMAYAAKSFNKPQRNHSTTKKELLVLVWGIKHFESYLLERDFRARTENNALRWLHKSNQRDDRTPIGEFNFTIEHRPGRLHGNADALPRMPSAQKTKDTTYIITDIPSTGDEALLTLQCHY